MSVHWYIANPKNLTYIELDKGSWGWLIEFLPDFMNRDTKVEDLDYLLKSSVNLSWKADDQQLITWWRDKIRNFVLGEGQNSIYLVADDTWIKCDMSHGLVDDIEPPFWRHGSIGNESKYTEIK